MEQLNTKTPLQKALPKKTKEVISKLNFKRIYPNLKTGDCIIHHPEVIHGSGKNNSNKDRVGFVVSFKAQKSKLDNLNLKAYKEKLNKSNKIIYKKN